MMSNADAPTTDTPNAPSCSDLPDAVQQAVAEAAAPLQRCSVAPGLGKILAEQPNTPNLRITTATDTLGVRG